MCDRVGVEAVSRLNQEAVVMGLLYAPWCDTSVMSKINSRESHESSRQYVVFARSSEVVWRYTSIRLLADVWAYVLSGESQVARLLPRNIDGRSKLLKDGEWSLSFFAVLSREKDVGPKDGDERSGGRAVDVMYCSGAGLRWARVGWGRGRTTTAE
jgi:hypothetical protein